GGKVAPNVTLLDLAEQGELLIDAYMVGHQFYQIAKAQSLVRQDRSETPEGQVDLLLHALRYGPVRPHTHLPGNEQQSTRLHSGRILERIKNLVATESWLIIRQAHPINHMSHNASSSRSMNPSILN